MFFKNIDHIQFFFQFHLLYEIADNDWNHHYVSKDPHPLKIGKKKNKKKKSRTICL